MVRLDLWLQFFAIEVVLCLTPGPAVFTVIAQGLRHGGRRSLFGNLGITAGNAMYFLLSALGVGAALAARPEVYAVLRWGAIAYLAWTALRMLRSRGGAEVAAAEGRPGALFRQGLVTQLGNPKALVFFVAVLTPFIDPTLPIGPQVAVYALTTFATEMPILAAYGLAAGKAARLAGGASGARLDRIAGGCLLVAAAWLAIRA